MSRTHNELSEVVVTATPIDTAGDPYTPTTARYRVDDCKTRRQLVDWTTIAVPSTSMQITVPGTANAIIGTNRTTPESKVLTLNTDKDLSTQHYEEYIYRIKDLGFAQVA